MHLYRYAHVAVALVAAAVSSAGCATSNSQSQARPILFSASCAPGSMTASQPLVMMEATEPVKVMPLFTASCRPDSRALIAAPSFALAQSTWDGRRHRPMQWLPLLSVSFAPGMHSWEAPTDADGDAAIADGY